MHILGLMGMPRRVYTYPDKPGWGAINLLETVGAFVLAAAVLVFLWNAWRSLRRGRQAGDDPWDGWTLEWATSSPPPVHNFATHRRCGAPGRCGTSNKPVTTLDPSRTMRRGQERSHTC